MSKITKGNPEIGMEAESIEAAAEQEVQEVPTGSVDGFFEQLENQVNGGIQETKVTQKENSGSEIETPYVPGPTENVTPIKENENKHNWEKRYKSSSKEAVKLKEAMSSVKPFMPKRKPPTQNPIHIEQWKR